MAKFPFEASPAELEAGLDTFVDTVFESLESEFLVLPRGNGFVEYSDFERAFRFLGQASGFTEFVLERLLQVVQEVPLTLVVLRTVLGFTSSEWAFVAGRESGVEVSQAYARSLDRAVRLAPFTPLRRLDPRLVALVRCSVGLLERPAPTVGAGFIHRLDKVDTVAGLESVRHLAEMGAPYAVLLYERLLGRPFAGHRDSVSELVGGGLEAAVERLLERHGIIYRKTKRATKIPGFDQAPDFVVPDEFAPSVVIEAKLTEDDGTARDKVTRVQHLASLSEKGQPVGQRRFEVIACIAGRGFGVRRSDMRKLLLTTHGKVFTLKTMERMVECSRLREHRIG